MSLLREVFNRINGTMDLEYECEQYDLHQENTRTGFGDMLHDSERNKKYYVALKLTINDLHAAGKEAHVLDIGTGSGLLAMMAVKCGADSVTACEAYEPMAKCAKKIIADNGMTNNINLIFKKSTSVIVDNEKGDMKRRANVLVTELFDTELIGEGAIDTFNHAHSNLLTDDCVVIPALATVYVQVFNSNVARNWNKPKAIANLDGEILLHTPKSIIECPGDASVHDIQLSQLIPSRSNFTHPLSVPIPIFKFDFTSKTPIEKKRSKTLKVKATASGTTNAVFFWWEIQMDKLSETKLSCAPFWAHPEIHNFVTGQNLFRRKPIQNLIPWRDHWLQAIYYLPNELRIERDQCFFLNANHDAFSFWFDISDSIKDTATINLETKRHVCECGFHIAYSRSRIGQINQTLRNKRFLRILESAINNTSNVLCLGEGSILQLAAAKLGAKSVTIVERFEYSRKCMESYIIENKLDCVRIVDSVNSLTDLEDFTHVICDPNFVTSIYPWDNLYFGTLYSSIQAKLNKDINVIPKSAGLYAMPIEFLDLDKIERPVGTCEGFNLASFDVFIQNSSNRTLQTKVEAHPLWEYPGIALGYPYKLAEIDFNNYLVAKKGTITIKIETDGFLNGIGLWIDWNLDETRTIKSVVTTGPIDGIRLGEIISWDGFTRQGVILFPNKIAVEYGYTLNLNFAFDPFNGKMSFNCDQF